MKTVFFGSSEYCLPILESLKKDLQLVITRPEKPIGRKQVLTPSPVALWAKKQGVPIINPATLKKDSSDRSVVEKALNDLKPDLGIVADYGLIIPETIFDIPAHGTFNIHFSRLPDLRGPSPVQFTLLRGDFEAWITIFKLENPPELEIKMDSGPILYQNGFPIFPNDTTGSLYPRLFQEAGTVLPALLNEFVSRYKKLTPQDHTKATFCHFLSRDDGFIRWETLQKVKCGEKLNFEELPNIQMEALKAGNQQGAATSDFIYHFFQAVTPWPGMWTIDPQGKRMKILKSHFEEKKFIPDEIQFEGKTPKPVSNIL